MINKVLPLHSARREAVKSISKPILRLFVPILRVRLAGRSPFFNKYTRKTPIVKRIVAIVESRLNRSHIGTLRQIEYRRWLKQNTLKKQDLEEQRELASKLRSQPLISVIVPTYNTDIKLLHECIQSVQQQTYTKWELCIADDASSDDRVVETIEKYARNDSRIFLEKRASNGHICEASNSALSLASGDYIALLDHDDILQPNALYEVALAINNTNADFIYTDEDKIDELGKTRSEPFFKPNWSFDYLRSVNYITHFAVIKKQLIDNVGGFRIGYEGAQDWDIFLRTTREARQIVHIPKILYSWRKTKTSTALNASSKEYAYVNQKKALESDLEARGFKGEVEWEVPYLMWRTKFQYQEEPLVSIIIPTKDSYEYISACLKSVKNNTAYNNLELVIIDTGSSDVRVWDLYEEYSRLFQNYKVVKWNKPFNFASVCNFGANKASGDYFLFLNNDTEVLTQNWVKDMLDYARQEGIGVVGCKLLYPLESRLQHAGVILGVGGANGVPGVAAHFFPAYIDQPPQDPVQPLYTGGVRNFSAVTAACFMVRKDAFISVGGFDDEYVIAFNDVDLCLKIMNSGLRNVYLPHVKLLHHESISVGQPGSQSRDLVQFKKEIDMMINRWPELINNDPFYHPEFRKDIANARLDVSGLKNPEPTRIIQ